jgi:ABC-type bacteriocin/lantibiotic exporter with double-glycine peptidase domain
MKLFEKLRMDLSAKLRVRLLRRGSRFHDHLRWGEFAERVNSMQNVIGRWI